MIEKERGNNNMDAVDIILKVIGWVVSPILSFTVGWLVSTQRKNKEKKQKDVEEVNVLKEASKAILKNMIRDDHEYFTRQGYCSPPDKQEVEIIYQCYLKLGGNGVGTQFRNDILSLPDSDPYHQNHIV